MPAVVPFNQRTSIGEAALHDPKMLALIRRTVAKDCDADEFDIFVQMCRALKLDPLRKQAYAFVFKRKGKKDEPEQRQLTLVTSIAGFRTIADRTGNYRPDEDAAELHFDEAKENAATNPLGFVKAVVRVWKFSHGTWHKVTSEAYWSEYAPIKEKWIWNEAEHKKLPSGIMELDTSGQWAKMPRVMLAKCAEAAALRKAFPDELSNVHEHAEIDREKFIDLSPAEAVEAGEAQVRLERIGGKDTLIADFLKGDMEPLEMVPVGQFADRALAFIAQHKDEPSQITLWANKNRAALKEFWARAPSDALELKKELEKATAGGQEG